MDVTMLPISSMLSTKRRLQHTSTMFLTIEHAIRYVCNVIFILQLDTPFF